jgi:hypothetical protein
MKARHAATLALVGWYLMMPPRGGPMGDQFYPNDPFSKSAGTDRLTGWRKFGQTEYATKDECEVEHEGWKSIFPDSGNIPKERITARQLARGAVALQCISSDDPRLKLLPATPVLGTSKPK